VLRAPRPSERNIQEGGIGVLALSCYENKRAAIFKTLITIEIAVR
jgi:hypothetical protein